ncbi:MAG: hypothetical protein GEU96_15520, partial [Propionibacteriales bacterium]|nr:hypothetical protein [Propionibacteriales bacterium]
MRRRISGVPGRFSSAALGSMVTILLITSVSSAPTGMSLGSAPLGSSGGSLPIVGDELPSGDGAAVDGNASASGSHWNVLNWGPGKLAAVPTSYSHPIVDDAGRTVQKVYIGSQANADVGSAESINNMSYSEDSGLSFLTTRRNSPVSALNMTRLPDGSLIAIEFIPEYIDLPQSLVRLKVWRSPDGISWSQQEGGDVAFPDGKVPTGMRVHRRILLEPDGTLMVPIYGSFQGSSKGYSAILQSTDTGVTWTYRSIIPATNVAFTNEVGFAYTSDNRLMAVMRTAQDLAYSFSDDHGRTWTEAKDLLGPDGEPVGGIYPDLVLQPNGTLLMTTGRPDVRYLVSYDGTGRTWDAAETIFANYPSTGNNGRFDGSSGNNTMENVAANRSVLYYDQCHVWGCGAYNEQFGVSAEFVGALTPGAGRIDVMSKLLDGSATVTGSFGKGDKNFPEQRPEGAFDGSSAPSAAAKLVGKNGARGQMTLTLDSTYRIDRIGLMLGNGEPQSATVQLSTDGVTWSTPVITATDRIDRAMKYADVEPQSARYLKVTGSKGSTSVTELELYAAGLDTFENELPFAVPRGWTQATHAWVTDVPSDVAYTEFGGYRSTTSLRLWDKWTDDNARIVKPSAETDHMYATMQFGGQDFRAKFTFGTRGTGADGADVDAWKFRLVQGSPATVEAFNGTAW